MEVPVKMSMHLVLKLILADQIKFQTECIFNHLPC